MMDECRQPLDEVLFAAVVEACSNTNRLDLISKHSVTAKYAHGGVLNASTYGTMIRAYSKIQDVQRVQQLWQQMIVNGVQPTQITLGCMVEALVSNGHVE